MISILLHLIYLRSALSDSITASLDGHDFLDDINKPKECPFKKLGNQS